MDGAVTYLSERTEGTRTDSMGTIMSGRLDLRRSSPQLGEEGCRRWPNLAPDYMAPRANPKTRHSGVLLSSGI